MLRCHVSTPLFRLLNLAIRKSEERVAIDVLLGC